MQIELVHGNHLGVATTCCSSFDAERRSLHIDWTLFEATSRQWWILLNNQTCDGCRTQAKTFLLRWAPKAWTRPIVVVLFPSPRGVGVMPAKAIRNVFVVIHNFNVKILTSCKWQVSDLKVVLTIIRQTTINASFKFWCTIKGRYVQLSKTIMFDLSKSLTISNLQKTSLQKRER